MLVRGRIVVWHLPVLEDDFGSEGVIEPGRVVPPVHMPEPVLLFFFGDVAREVAPGLPDARRVTTLSSELGTISV